MSFFVPTNIGIGQKKSFIDSIFNSFMFFCSDIQPERLREEDRIPARSDFG